MVVPIILIAIIRLTILKLSVGIKGVESVETLWFIGKARWVHFMDATITQDVIIRKNMSQKNKSRPICKTGFLFLQVFLNRISASIILSITIAMKTNILCFIQEE